MISLMEMIKDVLEKTNNIKDKNDNIESTVVSQDQVQAEILLNQMTIMEKQEQQDAAQAEILLNQMDLMIAKEGDASNV